MMDVCVWRYVYGVKGCIVYLLHIDAVTGTGKDQCCSHGLGKSPRLQ